MPRGRRERRDRELCLGGNSDDSNGDEPQVGNLLYLRPRRGCHEPTASPGAPHGAATHAPRSSLSPERPSTTYCSPLSPLHRLPRTQVPSTPCSDLCSHQRPPAPSSAPSVINTTPSFFLHRQVSLLFLFPFWSAPQFLAFSASLELC